MYIIHLQKAPQQEIPPECHLQNDSIIHLFNIQLSQLSFSFHPYPNILIKLATTRPPPVPMT